MIINCNPFGKNKLIDQKSFIFGTKNPPLVFDIENA